MVADRRTDSTSHPQGREQSPLFHWATLRVMAPLTLAYHTPVPGKRCEVRLTSGHPIQVWQPDDGQAYFCHGLTFGGLYAPGGPVSPFSGDDVEIILRSYYRPVDPESAALPGDILIWRGPGGDTPLSAILLKPVAEPGRNYLGYASELRTKNGIEPETVMTLEDLISDYYGEIYQVYRRM